MLCVVGDLLEDVIVRLAGAPSRGTDTLAAITRSSGGSGANVAVAAAMAGCAVRFIGRVGDDATGERLAASLTATGIDVRLQRSGVTGTVVVLVEPGGERTMLTDRAAAAELGPVDAAWAGGITWLHVPAYSLCAEPIGASTVELIQRARAAGARLSVDVSSVGVVTPFGADRFTALLGRLAPDVVLATRDEAELVCHRRALLVVKDGARPVMLRRSDGSEELVPVTAVDDVLDSTGAGDAFAGGFLAATIAGAAPAAAARAGAVLAARVVTVAGARVG